MQTQFGAGKGILL